MRMAVCERLSVALNKKVRKKDWFAEREIESCSGLDVRELNWTTEIDIEGCYKIGSQWE